MHKLMEKGPKTRVVPVVSEKSTFAELTMLIFYSFVEEDRELVEKILANREKALIDELDKLRRKCDILEKERNGFVKRLNVEENREKGLIDELDKLRRKCDVLEKERNGFDKRLNFEKNSGKRLIDELDQIKKKCDVLEKERNELEKSLNFEVEKSRESEILMKKKLTSVVKEKLKVEDVFEKYRNETEEKLRETAENGFEKILHSELEKSRENYEKELKRERDLIGSKLFLVNLEKLKVEDEFEKYRRNVEEESRIVAKSDVTQKSLNLEEGKSRESYGMTLKRERDAIENKLSLALLEKGKVEDEFKRYRTELGDNITILEREYGELKREIELRKEGDHEQVEKTLANQEKGLMCEAERRLTELKDRVEFLGRKNGELKMDSSCKRLKLEEKEVYQLKKDKGEVLDELETGLSSPNLSSMRGSPKSMIPESPKSARNLEFKQSKIHSEICVDKYEVCGIGQSSKTSTVVDSKCSEARTIGVQSGESRNRKKTNWKTSADMLVILRNDPELCMGAVCALYRRHIFAGKSTDDIGFRPFDIASGTEAAKYLINDDPTNKLSRSASEVRQDRPSILETCWKLAIKYLQQLFVMYQTKLDPLFCQEA